MAFTNLAKAVAPVAQNGGDVVVYRIIVTSMGLVLIAGMLGWIVLAALGHPVPPAMAAVCGTIVGSFTTMLTPQPRAPDPPTPPEAHILTR